MLPAPKLPAASQAWNSAEPRSARRDAQASGGFPGVMHDEHGEVVLSLEGAQVRCGGGAPRDRALAGVARVARWSHRDACDRPPYDLAKEPREKLVKPSATAAILDWRIDGNGARDQTR
jgi:hypothetical protein